ncbi:MAG: threonylcarbamoyl-AMP synthase [Rikenellaceae bacterium]|nr:threonylcarbamoyl-AMP synthase [Rikenellaceae bacterium]
MLIRIYDKNPNESCVRSVVETLNNDGVVVYPTDSVYAFGCSINSPKAIESLKKLSGKQTELTITYPNISSIADYAKVDNQTFKLLKRNLPGPFTFILKASSRVPSKFLEKRKTIGVRLQNNSIAQAILEELGAPMVTASIHAEESECEYMTDPELIHERYGKCVDVVINGGIGEIVPSTVVDCTEQEPEIIRQGQGELIY